jgi:hypothetical protein
MDTLCTPYNKACTENENIIFRSKNVLLCIENSKEQSRPYIECTWLSVPSCLSHPNFNLGKNKKNPKCTFLKIIYQLDSPAAKLAHTSAPLSPPPPKQRFQPWWAQKKWRKCEVIKIIGVKKILPWPGPWSKSFRRYQISEWRDVFKL